MENIDLTKILIIDDEPGILKMLSFALTRNGYFPETAQSGAEGIRKFLTDTFHLVMTDIKMPDMTGNQVIHELKRIKGNRVPVIGMSGTPWLLDSNLFDAVLEKPCSIKEVLEVVQKLLPSRQIF
jgi:DNA-binding response OmpR family regulator